MISIVKYVWILILMLVTFMSGECMAAENSLIGIWKRDVSMTLRNLPDPTEDSDALKQSAAKAKQFIEAQVKQDVFNMTLTYSDKECLIVLYDKNGNAWSKETTPYTIVDAENDFVVIKQLSDGKSAKLFFEGDSYFVEMRIGNYTYKDYFSRLSADR